MAGDPTDGIVHLDERAARVILVALGSYAQRSVRRLATPTLGDVERAAVGPSHRRDEPAEWTRLFFSDAPDLADYGAADLRPYRAFVRRADLVIVVAGAEETRTMRADRFVAEGRAAGALTVLLVLEEDANGQTCGADVQVSVGQAKIGDPRLSAAVGLFVDPLVTVGIVGWDFDDLRAVAADAGASRIGLGRARGAPGAGRGARAARTALDALGDGGVSATRGIHLLIRGGDDLKMREIEDACALVHAAAHEAADIVFAADVAGPAGEIEVRIGAFGAIAPTAPSGPTPARSSARELLQLMLDLGPKLPDEASLATCPPRQMRYERARAIARAIGLGDDLAAVSRGRFSSADTFERFCEIAAFAAQWAEREEEIRVARVQFGHDGDRRLRSDFRWLLEYRHVLERSRTWHSGVLAACGLGHLAVVQARRIAEAGARRVEELDELIARILDPSAQLVPRERLRELGYPEGDLAALDAEWM